VDERRAGLEKAQRGRWPAGRRLPTPADASPHYPAENISKALIFRFPSAVSKTVLLLIAVEDVWQNLRGAAHHLFGLVSIDS